MRVDLFEDNGGGLWLVPDADGIDLAVQLIVDGTTRPVNTFVEDARAFARGEWDPESDTPDACYTEAEAMIDQAALIATYHPVEDRVETLYAGYAGTAYLATQEGA